MKILLDANVWLSYLLAPTADKTVPTIVRACLYGDEIDLVAPQELLVELRRTLTTKPYFKSHFSEQEIDQFFTLLKIKVETPPRQDSISRYVSDPNDDYLIAYGLMYDVDYLVTGDAAVRMLEQVENLRIVSPAEFLEIAKQNRLV